VGKGGRWRVGVLEDWRVLGLVGFDLIVATMLGLIVVAIYAWFDCCGYYAWFGLLWLCLI
jgi:hypothetical protein